MTSLRAQKKRATSRRLAEAAYDLTIAHGFDAATTDEIAARAGVSRRTFANYYTNKHAAVVDGFIQHLGIPIWRPDDPIDPVQMPHSFNAFIDSAEVFISAVFKDNTRIQQIQEFAKMVTDNRALEPYIHAVFLEFQNSSSHKFVAKRFGETKVSLFIGAVIGSLGGIVRLILGPLAIPQDTPPLRGVEVPSAHGGTAPSKAPVLTSEDIGKILTHIDQAFAYLRRGFADTN